MAEVEKGPPAYSDEISATKSKEAGSHRRRSSTLSPDVVAGEVFDERYETTQRGLKSRHAQMIGTTLKQSYRRPHTKHIILSSRWHNRNRSLRRQRPNSRSWWSSFHPRCIHCHVLSHLVCCHWNGRVSLLDPQQWMLYEHVRVAICQSITRLCDGMAILLFSRNIGTV